MARILALGDKRDYAWNGEKVTLSTVPTYEVLELRQALERSYDTDAHAAPYYVVDDTGKIVTPLPRLKREAREAMAQHGLQVVTDAFFFDVDAPGHKATEAWWEETQAKIEALPPPLDCCGWYMTRGGARVVYEVGQPLTVEQGLMVHEYLALQLAKHGLDVDPNTASDHKSGKGWSRVYRLPYSVRDGKRIVYACDFGNLMPLDLPTDSVSLQRLLATARSEAPQAHSKVKAAQEPVHALSVGNFDPERPYAGIDTTTYTLPQRTLADGEGRYREVVRYAGYLCSQGWLPFLDFERALQQFNAAFCSPPKDAEDVLKIARDCYDRWMPPQPEIAPIAALPPPTTTDTPEHLQAIPSIVMDKPMRGVIVFPGESDVIIAETIVDHMQRGTGQRLVYDLGRLWCHEPESSLWRAITPAGLARFMHSFDGALMVANGGKTKPFSGDGKRLSTLQRMILSICDPRTLESEPNFFSSCPPGVATENGFLRLNEQIQPVLEPLRAEHRQTFQIPCEWRGLDYHHPLWDDFVGLVFANPDEQSTMAQFVGASLFGMATQFQRGVLFVGPGGNGKSTFAFVIEALLPPEAICSLTPADLAHDYKGAELFGKRLNICAELPIKDILNSDALKSVIPGDKVTRRPIFKDPVTARPIAGHLLLTNELSRSADHTDGFFRKFLIIQAPNRIKDLVQEIPDYEKKLTTKDVLPAVLAWAVRGLLVAIQNSGYVIPETVQKALAEWRKESDTVAIFIENECDTAGAKDWIRAGDVYQRYATWCDANGHKYKLNSTNFGLALARLGIERKRDATARWINIKWKDPSSKKAPDFVDEKPTSVH